MVDTADVCVFIGPTEPTPAPTAAMAALRDIEVWRRDVAPSAFRLTFFARRSADGQNYELLADDLLKPFNRVIIKATVGDSSTNLIDGFIIRQQLKGQHGNPSGSILDVVGEDVSVKMDMVELSTSYPEMSHSEIVEKILARYEELGFEPEVKTPETQITPSEYVPQQNETDRRHVFRLAALYDYQFTVTPSEANGTNKAYWGPRVTSWPPLPALTVGTGSEANVESINCSYDGLKPTVSYGSVLDVSAEAPEVVPVSAGASDLDSDLADDPALTSDEALASDPMSFEDMIQTLDVRGTLFTHQGDEVAQARSLAQGITDASAQSPVRITGEVKTLTYGAVLTSPGLVDLRGVGISYDGKYYVSDVKHKISAREGGWEYKQSFTLEREGVGSTIEEV